MNALASRNYLIKRAFVMSLSCCSAVSYAEEKSNDTEEVIVTGSSLRLPADLSSVPGSVTVLSEEEIQRQAAMTTDLGQILARTVPGMGVASGGTMSNFGQTLRGRKPAIFIDGVPVTVPLRAVSRDLRTISPGALGGVEVIRGATAIYGLGGGGGLINYVTREPGEGPLEWRSDVAIGGSLTHPSDSAIYSLQQSAVGRTGAFSYVFSGFYEKYDSLFDSDGDRIPADPYQQGGIAESEASNIFAKFGYDLAEGQRLRASFNSYGFAQDSDYHSGAGDFPNVKTPSVRGAPPGDRQINRNLQATLAYQNDSILGSALNVTGYYSDFHARFPWATTFAQPNTPWAAGGQSEVLSEHYGVRADVKTPLGFWQGTALWGFDWGDDVTKGPLTDGRAYTPPMYQDTFSPFVQLELVPVGWLTVVGGIRYETADIRVNTFTTIKSGSHVGGFTIQGGELKYRDEMYNAGVVVRPFGGGALQPVNFFAGFSQGFTVSDFGRALRTATYPTIRDFDFKAQIIDSYEVGVRGDWGGIKSSLVFFRSESEYGSTFNTVTRELVRAPEKVWGGEFALDYRSDGRWGVGMSATWSDGERTDIDQPLDTSRINPFKATAYYDVGFGVDWNATLQATYSGSQSRFPGSPQTFGQHDVEAFTLVDLLVGTTVGPGRLTLAITNLLNEDYFPINSWQDAIDADFVEGQGAGVRVSYSVKY